MRGEMSIHMHTDCESEWMQAPASVPLPRHEVHVWRVSLGVPARSLSDLPLCSQEYLRALRIVRHDDRWRFGRSHAVLRQLIATYLGMKPLEVAFCHPSHGKPALAGDPGRARLRFNLSRSGSVALIAFACQREVGVDVARVVPVPEAQSIAARFFSPADVARLGQVPEVDRGRTFMECWTKAEALAKAAGVGIFAAANGATALATRQWAVRSLALGSEYVASLAVEGDACPVRCWEYNPQFPTPNSQGELFATNE